jgi:hypothetical protein
MGPKPSLDSGGKEKLLVLSLIKPKFLSHQALPPTKISIILPQFPVIVRLKYLSNNKKKIQSNGSTARVHRIQLSSAFIFEQVKESLSIHTENQKFTKRYSC